MGDKALDLERVVITPEDRAELEAAWQNFSDKTELSNPIEVHSGRPFISKVLKLNDKGIFRSRVFQSRARLRKFDPYFISEYHRIPHWHATHFFLVAEQMYHASMETYRPFNQRYIVVQHPMPDLKDTIDWPARVNGHVSLIGAHQMVRGTWERRISFEKFSCTFYDDNEKKEYATITGFCKVSHRNYVTARKALERETPDAKERMIHLIKSQEENLKKLLVPRTDLLSCAEKLIQEVSDGIIPSEEHLDDFFSYYDRPQKANISQARIPRNYQQPYQLPIQVVPVTIPPIAAEQRSQLSQ